MSIGSRIKEARLLQKLTQEELANKLDVTKGAIANYENEVSTPKIEIMFKLMNVLKCDANYFYQDIMNTSVHDFTTSYFEQELIKKYRSLDSYGKKNVNNIVNNEYERCNKVEEEYTPYITRTHFSIGASAGNGETLIDDMYKSEITMPATKLNESADFVVDVKGNSMNPTFENGQKVLVKKQDSIDVGEIGIFIINNESFIKELGINELISHNKNYQNINLTEFDNVQCVGKVLGIINEKD